MSAPSHAKPPAEVEADRPAITIRGAAFTLTVAHLASADLGEIDRGLAAKVAQASDLFRSAPVVIDLLQVAGAPLDVPALLEVLRRHGVVPIAVRHGDVEQEAAAMRAGLGVLRGGRAVGGEPTAAPPAPPPPQPRPGRIVTQPVRSGQRVVATEGDLVILAPVNTGAEVLAAGNVHVYAPLRGRAMAGLLGDTTARIFTLALHAELVAIAGVYRAFEDDLPDDLRGRPAQVALEGDRLAITPLPSADESKRRGKST
jgi:septum site-determining protein MinC